MSSKCLRVLFNCTTNVGGGGVQNAANFIKIACEDHTIKFFFAISVEVDRLLNRIGVRCDRVIFEVSPSKSIKSRLRLRSLVSNFDVNLVYTMAGPAYVNFPCIHVLGISEPYVTHSDLQGFVYGRRLVDILILFFHTAYKSYYARNADFFIFQTESSKSGFCYRLKVDANKCVVIPNSLGSAFFEQIPPPIVTNAQINKQWIIFCPGAAYPHKAFQMIPHVARMMRDRAASLDFVFNLTLGFNSAIWLSIKKQSENLDVARFINNIGPYSYADAFDLYANSDINFIPSILEVFSTSYLEALYVGKPLVCADKQFSKEVCADAAIYFRACDSLDASSVLLDVIENYTNVIDSKRELALLVLKKYGDFHRRYDSIVSVLKSCNKFQNEL